ncbi:receptor-like protein 13 [Dioscorea cayenensis subsp. rotundata]|uniref:Receptor-like protein 13 n=1 Tax=Dioscorea cayennensis subsp. rotundata TaxID=55577 RepID=A0AB40ASJ7_DIOCR|nr:receptor-like protein 13 [Dioscorea cayenensis subsp. rotundata]
MSKLENLYLDGNLLSEKIIPCLIGASSLTTLALSGNMKNSFSWKELSKLKSLVELYLFPNKFIGVSPSMLEWTSLKRLYIYESEFNGTALEGLCKIKNLEELVIDDSNLKGNIPLCLGHLSSLKYIGISNNQLGTVFPSAVIKNLTMLKYAQFSGNNFKGILSIDIFSNNTDLKVLDLSNNYQLEVQTEHLGMEPSFQLYKIFLSNCILNKPFGLIPTFLSNQYMIESIDLSNANLKGDIPLWLFKNKTELKALNLRNNLLNGSFIFPSHKTNLLFFDVSNNKLSGEIPNNIGYVIPNVEFLGMSHNFLQGDIPSSFKNLSHLAFLDFSNNNLSSQISNHIGYLNNMQTLDLFGNNFQGNLFPNNSTLPKLWVYFADRNQFTGEVSNNFCMSTHLFVFSIGENQLSGVFPSCMRDLTSLGVFNARENKFEGSLPCEFFNLSFLGFLDLSKNNFSGLVPSCVNMSILEYLNLNGNGLKGAFPSALLGSSLVALDIGNNHFSGNISIRIWTDLKNLKIISLKGNHFEGAIPKEICNLQYLRILDLSQNKLCGKIPPCLCYMGHNGSLQLQVELNISSYQPSESNEESLPELGSYVTAELEYIEFPTKRRSDSYKGNILNYLSGLDLSGNQFDGKIPEEIGEMTWLRALNLSNNRLTGPIPATLSRLGDIESLDLSHNMLVGCIPPQLVQLHSLEVFSVAYNNLSGPTIGLVAQFSTFDKNSYEGNPYLCGPPLENTCTLLIPVPKSQVTKNIHEDKEAAKDHLILYATIALGFSTGFWGWMALLYFNRSWQYSFFLAIDKCMKEALDMASSLLMKMSHFGSRSFFSCFKSS